MRLQNSPITRRKHTTSVSSLAAILLLLLFIAPFGANADTITLKSGETLEGRIIAESADMVRIEVEISSSIRETKTLAMSEVAKIEKAAPDKVAFAAIKEQLPTRPLMSSSDYEQMIRTGPARFLSTFPESFHAAEVEAILADLKKEKDLVQRGSIKLGDDWISREHRQDYRFDIEATIRLYNMRQKAAANNTLGALRDFELLEERYAETPAHATGLATMLQIVPNWGSNLQRRLSNVEILNAQDEEALKLAKEDERTQVMAARVAEEQRYATAIEQEKNQGILWTSVNFRSKPALEDAIALASKELARLSAIDTAELTTKAEMLYEANRLLSEGDLAGARAKVGEATGGKTTSKSRSSRSKSKSSGASAAATSYSKWLLERIREEETLLTEAAKAKADAGSSSSEAKSSLLAASGEAGDAKPAGEGEGEGEGEPAADGEDKGDTAEDSPAPTRAELMAAAKERSSAKRAAEEKAAAENDGKKKTSSSSKKKKKEEEEEDDDAEDEEEEESRRSSGGGGFNPRYIIYGIAGILVLTVVIMKAMGLGGAKN